MQIVTVNARMTHLNKHGFINSENKRTSIHLQMNQIIINANQNNCQDMNEQVIMRSCTVNNRWATIIDTIDLFGFRIQTFVIQINKYLNVELKLNMSNILTLVNPYATKERHLAQLNYIISL